MGFGDIKELFAKIKQSWFYIVLDGRRCSVERATARLLLRNQTVEILEDGPPYLGIHRQETEEKMSHSANHFCHSPHGCIYLDRKREGNKVSCQEKNVMESCDFVANRPGGSYIPIRLKLSDIMREAFST